MAHSDEDDMLAALGADTAPEETRQYTRREERLIAGFEDIQQFYKEQGHSPHHGEDRDIFERLYAVRLDRLRESPEVMALLTPMDNQGLLRTPKEDEDTVADTLDEDSLLAELESAGGPQDDITVLRHVRSQSARHAAVEVAEREQCRDFDRFEPLFQTAQAQLDAGARQAVSFGQDASIEEGNFFILAGQIAYVAAKGDEFKTIQGHPDARLRVIFSNGTESNLLLRSLQRALYKDDTARRLSDPDAGPLFSESMDAGDTESGTIYVLRSLSDEPYVAKHRELIHKIGVTSGQVETRIANAKNDPTYLLADVEIVATWKLSGINRTKLEKLLHRIFAPAQLELIIEDRFGKPVKPREWFLVPWHILDEAVRRIMDGSITQVAYDPNTASFIEQNDK